MVCMIARCEGVSDFVVRITQVNGICYAMAFAFIVTQ